MVGFSLSEEFVIYYPHVEHKGEEMKTDRELLELAAKAAGIKFDRITNECGLWAEIYENNCYGTWNSLDSDGDALRLAVKLNIEFACFDDMEQVNAGVWEPGAESWDCMTPYNGDKQDAARRAITRAAAQMQMSKENK